MSTKTSKKRNRQNTTPPDALAASPNQTKRVALALRRVGHCEEAVKQAKSELKRATMMYDDAIRDG